MKRFRNSSKGYYWGGLITYFLACCLILNTSLPVVMAAPTGGVVDLTDSRNGNAAITYNTGLGGLTTLVDVATRRTVINWASLHTAGGPDGTRETLAFTQALAGSAVLNKVSGPRTLFYGTLQAPGMRIFIVNPAGITFGNNSMPFAERSIVNVSQLVASSLDMSTGAFHDVLDDPANEMVFQDGYPLGSVNNYGYIAATDSVHLIGRKVSNSGPIIANGGLIVMAAGEKVYIAQDGSNVRVELSIEPSHTNPDIRNANIVSASNGTIVLAAGDNFSRAIENVSILAASGGTVTAHAAKINNKGHIDVSSSTNGGSINLTGIVEVSVGPDGMGNSAIVNANAGTEGNGGTITIESEGLIKLQENSLITAKGGSVSGDGGHVKITSERFTIAGDIDASPASTDFEPGTLVIDPSSVTIANGPNPTDLDPLAVPAENTLYEGDIEKLSNKGTSVIVYADENITVEDMVTDGTIKGGFGNIELHATGNNSSVTFVDNTNTIRTTLGDIVIEAGSGGINVGNLITGMTGDVVLGTTPGQIILGADYAGDIHGGGDITTGNLIIEGGSGHAEINVDASGELTINGDVIVGRNSAIDNISEGTNAEAMIYLKAGDHVKINQEVSAFANATHPGNSKANIEISAGTNDIVEGDAYINGNVLADASASDGTAEAIVKIEAWGKVQFAEGKTAHAITNGGTAEAGPGTEDDEDWSEAEPPDHAQIIIKAENKTLTGLPDFFPDIHMGSLVEGNVLTNDLGPADKAELVTNPSHAASFTLNEDGTFSYTPEAGFVGEDTFTYKVISELGEEASPILVTITITNNLPVLTNEAEVIHMGAPLSSNVLTNDTDPDSDLLSVVLNGTAPEHGQVTLNADGSYTYTPDKGYVGEDSFTYEVTDGQLDELKNPVVVTGTATITIGNNPPTPKDDTATTRTSEPISGNVLKNDTDPDSDPLSVVLNGTAPQHGKLTLKADGSFTYTSDDGFVGEDKFTYIVTDGAIGSEPIIGTVIITVNEKPIYLPPAPLPERIEFEISGYPALAKWVAEELGVDERMIDIWMVNTVASSRKIQPVDTYTRLKAAAIILKDSDGVYIAALTQVVNEFASSLTPPTEEQMASIAEAITRNGGDDSHYALAGKYLRALADYIGILNSEMGFSAVESVQFVTNKYINRLTGDENVGVAAFLAASASALAG